MASQTAQLIRAKLHARAAIAQAHHESGQLPFPVGEKFTTEHSREHDLPPWQVVSHYADDAEPERYGYEVKRSEEGRLERTRLLANDPEGGKDYGELAKTWRLAKASGGAINDPSDPDLDKLHVGPIHSPVAGRTDHLPMHVPSGAYVIPADIVSAMGEGNTMAGFAHLRRMFSGQTYGQGPTAYDHTGGPYSRNGQPFDQPGGPYDEPLPTFARGGSVPIVAAGGEYVLSPHQVAKAGNGDVDIGHKVLDEFVKRTRSKTVKTLQHLPGPKKD